ncbi:MAG: abortive infection system antitoxin AbiGi family protein [Sedimentisphaerales bacterium]
MNFDYAIHSDFLIHWTGKDIDDEYDKQWYESDKSKTNKNCDVTGKYIKRLKDILKYGLWMTEKQEDSLCFKEILKQIPIPITPTTCFTELKLSESRKHARRYGRLGIGVKRPFLFKRWGRPLIYYLRKQLDKDIFLKDCVSNLEDNNLLNFFKPMNSSTTLNYDLYAESEWRILYFEKLLSEIVSKNSNNTNTRMAIIDPRNCENKKEHAYFNDLTCEEQKKIKYLIPLDGWLSMIIYPSLDVKNKAQQDDSTGIKQQIKIIKDLPHVNGKRIEGGNRPIEVDLDACRNF